MKTDIVKLLYLAIALVLAGAMQETMPTFGAVKPPVLLAFSLAAACSGCLGVPWRIGAGIAAGVVSGSLSSLPPACAEFFFFAASWVAAMAWQRRETVGGDWMFGFVALALAAPAMQVWLYLWGVPGTGGSILARTLPAMLLGAPTGAILFALAAYAGEHLGIAE